ncbi:hypothetical protein H4219_002067 [Mycoemilia scoparia]|uniref:PCI domain-containing protein n=1 Tax=Mycoemilia scoparia TaxID=417184 RepID=A0A9W7ZYQ6_9FUNG|nr:hypothetical protein H4219_002067 [Mycoemilia scoparia]
MDDDDFMYDDDDYLSQEDEENEENEEDILDDVEVKCENMYYKAKEFRETDMKSALDQFRDVIELEKNDKKKGEWGFRALKQTTKLHLKHNQPTEALDSYKELLTYIESAVTRDYGEQSISKMLERFSDLKDITRIEAFFNVTLDILEQVKNTRLQMKVGLRLGRLFLEQGEYSRLEHKLKELYAMCPDETSETAMLFSSQINEVFALELQMHSRTQNIGRLKEVYNRSKTMKISVLHPRIKATVNECGGIINMSEKKWSLARTDFYESFRNFDEAGDIENRIRILKYLILACMLDETGINPFDYRETKPYVDNPEIKALVSLVEAYRKQDIVESERILKENGESVLDDPLIKKNITDVIQAARAQTLLQITRPYTSVSTEFLAKKIRTTSAEVEHLLSLLILDKKIDGVINQVTRQFVRYQQSPVDSVQHKALNDWANSVDRLLTKTVHLLN